VVAAEFENARCSRIKLPVGRSRTPLTRGERVGSIMVVAIGGRKQSRLARHDQFEHRNAARPFCRQLGNGP